MKFSNAILAGSVALAAHAAPAPVTPVAVPDSGSSDASLRNMQLTRSGSQLLLNGTKWQSSGANVYWLGLDENVTPPAGQPFDPSVGSVGASYPTKGRITEAMNTVRAMGGKHIRGHTLGISYGHKLSLWPTLETRNEQAWETIDWAIYEARQHGLRLQIPLMDNYDWFHGGKYVWLRWYGYNITTGGGCCSSDPASRFFYTDPKIIQGFKSYIKYWLTHVNQYTGLTIAEDPTVSIIETGNELGGPVFGDAWVPNSWTKEIATYVNSFTPSHAPKLIMDGTVPINSTHFELEEIDIFTQHFYPLNTTLLEEDFTLVSSANRTYFAGEFDWTGLNGGSNASDWYNAIETQMKMGKDSVIAGDSFWSLFGHDVGATHGCSKFVNHTDGFTLQYNNPLNSASTNRQIRLLRQHMEAVGGKKVGLQTPAVGCPGPAYQAGGTK